MKTNRDENKSISIFSAAKRLGETSHWTLSHLTIQKLSYIAQMFHLGKEGSPLIQGNFEAWMYGPVHPELYHELKIFGAQSIPHRALKRYPNLPDNHSGIVYLDDAVIELAQKDLIHITHWNQGAWWKRYNPHIKGIKISNDDILEEFTKRVELAEQQDREDS